MCTSLQRYLYRIWTFPNLCITRRNLHSFFIRSRRLVFIRNFIFALFEKIFAFRIIWIFQKLSRFWKNNCMSQIFAEILMQITFSFFLKNLRKIPTFRDNQTFNNCDLLENNRTFFSKATSCVFDCRLNHLPSKRVIKASCKTHNPSKIGNSVWELRVSDCDMNILLTIQFS